jgi:phosphoserine phosphatase
MTRGPWRLATFDLDGTLTLVHGWRALGEAFGRVDQYERAMAAIRSGRAPENETLTALLRITEGRTVDQVEAVLAATPKLAHLPEGVRRLRDEGIHSALLTHNPPYVTDWYRRFAGFEDAGGMRGDQATHPVIGPPHDIHADKPGALYEFEARHAVPAAQVVHVGDARPDAAIFRLVGGGIALNADRPDVVAAADLALRTTDFSDVVEAILHLPARVER